MTINLKYKLLTFTYYVLTILYLKLYTIKVLKAMAQHIENHHFQWINPLFRLGHGFNESGERPRIAATQRRAPELRLLSVCCLTWEATGRLRNMAHGTRRCMKPSKYP